MKSVLGIILARKGSKRFPGKNVMPIFGIPLIEYTIKTALDSSLLSQIVISTDDKKVKKIAQKYNDVVVLNRPERLAGDDVKSEDVIFDIIMNYSSIVGHHDYIMLLQPTSPLRETRDIYQAIHQVNDCLVSVRPNYTWNGAIFIIKWSVFERTREIKPDSYLIMPEERSIDIDTVEDFKAAERYIDNKFH